MLGRVSLQFCHSRQQSAKFNNKLALFIAKLVPFSQCKQRTHTDRVCPFAGHTNALSMNISRLTPSLVELTSLCPVTDCPCLCIIEFGTSATLALRLIALLVNYTVMWHRPYRLQFRECGDACVCMLYSPFVGHGYCAIISCRCDGGDTFDLNGAAEARGLALEIY